MIWILLIVGTLAHATMLWLHCSRMWAAEHFQFFPVAFAAAGFLAYSRRFELVSKDFDVKSGGGWTPVRGSPWLVSIGMLVVVTTLFFAVSLSLVLVGWLNYLLFLATLIYASYSWRGLRAMLPAFIVLLVIKPVPGFLEQFLTIGMQHAASSIASYVLDLVGIVHYTQGVVLYLAQKSFMAEEACSGIRSLFSSITAIVCWGLYNRFSFRRHVLNILQTIGWVVIWNAIRIAVVVAVEDRTSISLAEGFPHTALGFAIFFIIFGMVLSTDQLLASVVEPREFDELTEGKIPDQWFLWLHWPASETTGIGFTLCFVLLALFSARLLFLFPEYARNVAAGELATPVRENLPTRIGEWETQGFEHVHREQDFLQGRDSYIWQLRKGERKIFVSVDGTFAEFHDLWHCYSALGWRCISERNYTSIDQVAKGSTLVDGEYSMLKLSKLSGETGIVIFTGLDRTGQIVVPIPDFGQETGVFLKQSILNSLRFAIGMQTDYGLRATTFTPPISNIQLVYYPSETVGEIEIAELKELFLAAREILQKSPRFTGIDAGVGK